MSGRLDDYAARSDANVHQRSKIGKLVRGARRGYVRRGEHRADQCRSTAGGLKNFELLGILAF